MIITPNRELEKAVYSHARDYMAYDRTGLHASTLIFCNYKGFFEATDAEKNVMDDRTMLFILGHAIQFMLYPVTQEESKVFEVDGIRLTPDLIDTSISSYYLRLAEVKSTRASSAKFSLYDNPHYTMQMANYCKAVGVLECDFIGFLLAGDYKPPLPKAACWKVAFTQDEIDYNWEEMLRRKKIFEKALQDNRLPEPLIHMSWECKYCDYVDVCPIKGAK